MKKQIYGILLLASGVLKYIFDIEIPVEVVDQLAEAVSTVIGGVLVIMGFTEYIKKKLDAR